MDRTSRTGLFVCLILLLGLEFAVDKFYPAPPHKPKPAATATASSPTATTPGGTEQMTSGNNETPTSLSPAAPVEKLTVIENDAMKVTFTTAGAAITEIDLKQQRADNGGSIILNEQARTNILALKGWPGADTANFQVQENGGQGVTYTCDLPNDVKWQRTYSFGQEVDSHSGMTGYLRVLFRSISKSWGQSDPKPLVYTLDVSDTLTNSGATDATLPAYSMSVGRAQPLIVNGRYQPGPYNYPGSGWLGSKFRLTTISDFSPGFIPFLGIPTHGPKDLISSTTYDQTPLRWIGVENQFFAVLLTPVDEKAILNGQFQCFNQWDSNGKLVPQGAEPDIEAAANFAPLTVPAGKAITLNYGLYAGPKDFNRLDALGANQGELMNYGWFELLIVPMLTILKFWYLIFGNYGVAIILLTLMIKAITWPLQSIANRSGKRMQALAPKLKEIQAKYKESPEKLQTETFALYKDYGVNPFGGCLPALIQMPVFFSLYFMLQNAVELRGQSFLWVHDLTQPDALWTAPFLFFGFHPSLNPLPIIVTGLMAVMMRMTPQIGDPTQAKVAQFMPLIFLFIFYNFAAALSLYYVINNCVSILQIYRNLRKPMPDLKRKPKQPPPK